MRIKLNFLPHEFVLRQTPSCAGRWNDCQFLEDDDGAGFNAWVVFDRLLDDVSIDCDPERTIFITGEPQSIRTYDPRFLAQFGTILTFRTDIDHPRVIHQHAAFPWVVGIQMEEPYRTGYSLDYDTLKAMDAIAKTKILSVTCTTKTNTPEHEKRLRFVERLKSALGDQCEIFGRGFTPILDKWTAIAPYRYHITLENSSCPHYWSEKIADAFLGMAFPMYWGCPNLRDYFPDGSFANIDRENFNETLGLIGEIISSNRYEEALPKLQQARNMILDQYNVFPVIADLVRRLPSAPRRRITIKPEARFTDRLSTRVKRRVKWLLGRESIRDPYILPGALLPSGKRA